MQNNTNLINYSSIKSVYLKDARLLFGSIRFIDDSIFIISVPYQQEIDYNRVILKDVTDIKNKNIRSLKISNNYYHDKGESVQIIQIQSEHLKDISSINLYYEYNDEKGFVFLDKENFDRKKLVAMTVCLHDYDLITAYINHYHNLGVEQFYIYYNGKLNDIKEKNKEVLKKFKNININFIELNLQYWDIRVKTTPHSAQVIAINDFLYLSKYFFDFVIFNDFDEYFYLFKDIQLQKNNSYVVEKKFAMVNNIDYNDMEKQLSKNILVNKVSEGVHRVKIITDPNNIIIAGVHRPPQLHNQLIYFNSDNEIFHAHCIDFKKKNRKNQFIHDTDNMDKIILNKSCKFIF